MLSWLLFCDRLYKFIEVYLYLVSFDVLVATAAFVGTTVRQMSLWRIVSCHRYDAVSTCGSVQSQRNGRAVFIYICTIVILLYFLLYCIICL